MLSPDDIRPGQRIARRSDWGIVVWTVRERPVDMHNGRVNLSTWNGDRWSYAGFSLDRYSERRPSTVTEQHDHWWFATEADEEAFGNLLKDICARRLSTSNQSPEVITGQLSERYTIDDDNCRVLCDGEPIEVGELVRRLNELDIDGLDKTND